MPYCLSVRKGFSIPETFNYFLLKFGQARRTMEFASPYEAIKVTKFGPTNGSLRVYRILSCFLSIGAPSFLLLNFIPIESEIRWFLNLEMRPAIVSHLYSAFRLLKQIYEPDSSTGKELQPNHS